ncbi:GGDEF domain-containing protein [Tianweitania sediminis]|uniref:diguanylate cyclase n=1 Tax=Tianweitania sediminis TaxID=1502156 RepID=A0A8J7RN09_9HYPH|nr:GGDEF domain-containing protein [Tianweitania sediminis]MBP0441356.1 GGDEF domain-containing protein [Tianweitania sediminis]
MSPDYVRALEGEMVGEFIFRLLNPLILLVLGVSVLLLWRRHRGHSYLLLLAVAFTLAGTGFAANDLLRPLDGLALRAVVNALFFGAVLSVCLGSIVRINAPIPSIFFAALSACSAVAFCWFLIGQPSTVARIYIVNVTYSVLATSTVVILIRAGPKSWVDRLFVAHALLLLFVALSRPLALFVDRLDINTGGSLKDSDYWTMVQAMTPLIAMTIALSFLTGFGFQLFNELRDDAEHDHLTALLNRRGFERRASAFLKEMTASRHQWAVMMVDIDDFKAINDTFGHDVGDRVIMAVANVLKRQGADNVARVGGEEFALFYNDAHSGQLTWHAARIRTQLSRVEVEPIPRGYPITVSIGLHLRDNPFERLGEAMRQADQALYAAKHSGKNQAAFARPIRRSVT